MPGKQQQFTFHNYIFITFFTEGSCKSRKKRACCSGKVNTVAWHHDRRDLRRSWSM